MPVCSGCGWRPRRACGHARGGCGSRCPNGHGWPRRTPGRRGGSGWRRRRPPRLRARGRCGVLVPGQAGDAGGAGDQGRPVGVELARTAKISTSRFSWRPWLRGSTVLKLSVGDCVAASLERGQQARLVVLDLDQQRVAGRGRRRRFFWQCRASAVNRMPLRPSCSISACAAAISSPSAIS